MSVPGSQETGTDEALVLSPADGNAIAIDDPAAGSAGVQVALSVGEGALTLADTTGLSFSSGNGTSDATMTFSGAVAAINSALNGLSYTPRNGYNGMATLSVSMENLRTNWAIGARSASGSVAIEVGGPSVSVPDMQWTKLNTTVTFSSSDGNAIAVSDPVSSSIVLDVDVSVDMGTVALATTNGLTIVSGNPSGDSDIEFTGTASNIDAALNGLTYTPSTGIGGEATLSVSAIDQGDGGAVGFGRGKHCDRRTDDQRA